MTQRYDSGGVRAAQERWNENTDPAVSAAIDAYNAGHRAADCEWLATLLHDHAARGDGRARRLLSHFAATLAKYGATIPVPTWAALTSPERADELAEIVKEYGR